MNMMLLAGLSLILLIVAGTAAAVTVSTKRDHRQRTMAIIRGEKPSEKDEFTPAFDSDRRREEITEKLREQDHKKQKLSSLLVQGGMNITARQYLMFSLAFASVATGLSWLAGTGIFVMAMVFATAFLGIPHIFLKHKIKKRQKKFLDEFADVLEAMVRLLKAGMPIAEAVSMAAREFSGPVGEEMMQIYEAQRVGIPLAEAVQAAAQRMPVTEMQMFATGVTIQTQTGSSLSEVLTNMAGMIRSRYRLKRKVQALSSEAKTSAIIIGSLPFLVASGMYFINPDYILVLFENMAGRVMLVISAVWMAAGIFVMKTMIDFKV